MTESKQFIILTGLPGVGKTSIIKNIIKKLKELNQPVNGFYTEEVRENNVRIGFDIVDCNGHRTPLARKGFVTSKYKVGTYNVFLEDFETIALPTFINAPRFLIVDEIGKMELFSKKFEYCVKKAFSEGNSRIIATVPMKINNALVEEIKQNHRSKLILVDRSNRNNVLEEIMSDIISK